MSSIRPFVNVPIVVPVVEDNNINKLGTSKNIEITANGVVIKCNAIFTDFL